MRPAFAIAASFGPELVKKVQTRIDGVDDRQKTVCNDILSETENNQIGERVLCRMKLHQQ